MRHAEAAQTAPGGRDRDRPLTAAGVADALAVGHRLNASGLLPDLALASDARRTRETLEGLSPALRVQPEIRLDPALYRADGRELLDRIREEGGTADCLLVIGHNPAIAELATGLGRHGDGAARRGLARGFPPGAVAVFAVDCAGWSELAAGCVRLRQFLRPDAMHGPAL